MAIDLYYHVISPPARAVLVLAKHIGLSLNEKNIDLMAGETRTPEYLKLNPSHTVPTLVDNGFALFESRAILAYLVDKYQPGTLYPADVKQRALIDRVLFFEASSVFPALKKQWQEKYFHNKEPSAEVVADVKEKLNILTTLLGSDKFYGGENVSIADISLGVSLVNSAEEEFFPQGLKDWYKRVVVAVPELETYNNQAKSLFVEFIEKHKAHLAAKK